MQYRALQWLMNQETEESSSLEREKIKATMVAVNPQLYNTIYREDVVADEEIEWLTPRTEEDMDRIVEQLNQLQVGSEQL